MNTEIAAKISALNKERRKLTGPWYYRFGISSRSRIKEIDFELEHLKVQELFQKPVQHLSAGEELQMTDNGLAIVKVEEPLKTYQVLMVINRNRHAPVSWVVKATDEKQAIVKAVETMLTHLGDVIIDIQTVGEI